MFHKKGRELSLATMNIWAIEKLATIFSDKKYIQSHKSF